MESEGIGSSNRKYRITVKNKQFIASLPDLDYRVKADTMDEVWEKLMLALGKVWPKEATETASPRVTGVLTISSGTLPD
mgnify:CR=1 FL=1